MSLVNVRRGGPAPEEPAPDEPAPDGPALVGHASDWPALDGPELDVDAFRILYVCSANVCRSVMAERLTGCALLARPGGQGLRFRVSSAGLQALTGEQAHPYTAAALARMGANVAGFVARQLTPELLRDNDLVLTATVRHRDKAVAMLPAASRRVFTIREFARIARHLPDYGYPPPAAGIVERARWVVDAVATMRGQVERGAQSADDIADPARRPGAFRSCARGIATAVDGSVRALCP
jgi:protein-tyrosine phosphatase